MYARPPSRLALRLVILIGIAVASHRSVVAQLPLADQRIVVTNELDVNTVGLDYPAAVLADGLVYVSTVSDPRLKRRMRRPRWGRRSLERLLLAEGAEGGDLAPVGQFIDVGGGRVNAGPLAIDSAAGVAYVTRNAAGSRTRSAVAARLQIYEFRRTSDGDWGGALPLEFADATSNDAHPTLAPDGSLLVFASDRDGGYGGLDLWGVRRASGMWGAPFNLGPGVNSGGNEAFPFLHADGTLYYAATVPGAGGGDDHLDLVYSRLDGDAWEAPVSLGAPFNTPADDFALLVDEDNRGGYFASSRAGGLGADDIYRFDVIGEAPGAAGAPAELAIAVVDAETGVGLAGASVVYLDADTTSLSTALARDVVTVEGRPLRVVGGDRYMTDVNGEGLIGVRAGTFLLEIAREGYAHTVLEVDVAPGQTTLPVALSRKRECAEFLVSVVDEATVFPVAGALLAAVSEAGSPPVTGLTSADGTARVCVPCGEVMTLNAIAGEREGRPLALDARGDICDGRLARTTVTVYLTDEATDARLGTNDGATAEGTPLAPGTRFQMPDVYYALSDYRLSDGAKANLDQLARLLKQFPETKIEVGSHTDANGPAAFNRDLSQRRADEARRYLVEEQSIAADRIVAVGYGESALRNHCRDGVTCGPALHRENRRTEVKILGDGVYASRIGVGPAVRSAPGRAPAEQLSPPKPVPVGSPSRETAPQPMYFVIAGTYATPAEAAPDAAELRALGYDGITVERVRGVAGFAVVGGRFEDAPAAIRFALALREAHGRDAFVERVDRRPR